MCQSTKNHVAMWSLQSTCLWYWCSPSNHYLLKGIIVTIHRYSFNEVTTVSILRCVTSERHRTVGVGTNWKNGSIWQVNQLQVTHNNAIWHQSNFSMSRQAAATVLYSQGAYIRRHSASPIDPPYPRTCLFRYKAPAPYTGTPQQGGSPCVGIDHFRCAVCVRDVP